MGAKKEKSVVSSAVMEMSRLVRLAASPAIPGEKVPHAIARAARRLGVTRGRAECLWYGKIKNIPPEELDATRAEAIKRSRDAELLRNEHRRALDILARLEAGLAAIDPDFFSQDIDAYRDMAGGEAGPGDSDPERR